MDPGAYRTPLVLERQVQKRDAGGSVTTTWEVVLPLVWVNLRPLTGRELLLAKTAEARLSHRVTMAWRPDLWTMGLDPTFRFRRQAGPTGNRVLNIQVVRDLDEAHRELELDVEEVVGAPA